jgi:hypothetical protein
MGQKGPGQQATEGSEARMSQIIDPVEATDLRIGVQCPAQSTGVISQAWLQGSPLALPRGSKGVVTFFRVRTEIMESIELSVSRKLTMI